MRRIEREKSVEFAESVIDRCDYMVLAVTLQDGTPYCVPLSPVRWEGEIYFHCALEGTKLEAMRQHPQVAMTFVGRVEVPNGVFTTYYESAIASGIAAEVVCAEEKTEALRRLCLKYCPGDMDKFDAAVAGSLPRTGVWKIHMNSLTGKSNFPVREERLD